MANVIPLPADGDWQGLRRALALLYKVRLAEDAEQEFADLVLSGLSASRLIASNSDKKLVSTDAASWVLEGSSIQVTNNGNGTVSLSLEEVADATARLATDHRLVYQQDDKKFYVRRT